MCVITAVKSTGDYTAQNRRHFKHYYFKLFPVLLLSNGASRSSSTLGQFDDFLFLPCFFRALLGGMIKFPLHCTSLDEKMGSTIAQAAM